MDALESVGRKTMDILSEGDPRLKKKREMFIAEHPTLSQVCAVCTQHKVVPGGNMQSVARAWRGGSLVLFSSVSVDAW